MTGSGSIAITYDARGRKLQQTGPSGTRVYLNGAEYLDGKLEAVQAADGRLIAEIDPNTQAVSKLWPEYHLKDHLGNVRLSFIDENKDGFIVAYDDPDTPENEAEINQVGAKHKSRTAVASREEPLLPLRDGTGWGLV